MQIFENGPAGESGMTYTDLARVWDALAEPVRGAGGGRGVPTGSCWARLLVPRPHSRAAESPGDWWENRPHQARGAAVGCLVAGGRGTCVTLASSGPPAVRGEAGA